LFASPGAPSSEVWFDARDGGVRRFVVSRVPFDQSASSVAPKTDLSDAMLVVAMDVTEERRLEVQLQFAQRLEVVGTLAGGIAHDFNNLLTPMLGYATLLLDRELPADVTTKVKAIHGASLKARDLVQQILTFSRQRNEPSEKHRVDLRAIVDDALHLMRATIPSSIEMHLEADAAAFDIDANAGQIHQIVVNLLANAAQAIRGARGHVAIRLSRATAQEVAALDDRPARLSPNDYAVLTVHDDGIGMSPAVKSRIFEPFFTTKTVGQGSGLGLSVVRGIVTAHRGAIAVESQEGAGATFRIFLPSAAATPTARSAARRELSRGDERVMLVDDDGAVVRATKDLLENLGYRVQAFTQAGTALDQFRRDRAGFDVIVTDNLMPGMTGLELANEVRQIDSGIPIVLMTGFVDDTAECNPAISVAIMKPVSGQELSSGIQRALRARAAA
jgi:signal transduction histidine kinase/CheY-like chemotaxis protein